MLGKREAIVRASRERQSPGMLNSNTIRPMELEMPYPVFSRAQVAAHWHRFVHAIEGTCRVVDLRHAVDVSI